MSCALDFIYTGINRKETVKWESLHLCSLVNFSNP